MTYLDEIGSEIERELSPDQIPSDGAAQLFRLYALLALVKGREVDAGDVHDAWAVWTQERTPTHRSLIPFEQLDSETQAWDEPFVEAIKAVAERLIASGTSSARLAS
jgi:hypothetical protein